MQQHKSNLNQANFQVDPYSNFLRILLTVIHYRFLGFGNFDENNSELFTKHFRKSGKGLEKVAINNLDKSTVGFICYKL